MQHNLIIYMLDLITKGIIIGILVSAPMGPVGILCVQRTLSKGRWFGFAAGLGATLSDLIYATLTCLAMGMISDFVDTYRLLLQIFGSVVLVGFGFYLFRSNPSRSIHAQKEKKLSYTQDFFTSFLLTFSNVLIVFLYIGLYARFDFVKPQDSIWELLGGGLSGVFIGAVMWWFIITSLVSMLRRWFNLRSLWILNRIVGIIIVVIALIGLSFSVYKSGMLTSTLNYNTENMKTINVPYLPTLENEPIEAVSTLMEGKATRLFINTINWPNTFPYQPIVVLDLARTKQCLCLHYFVRGQSLLATTKADDTPVYKDSCVEFFMKKEDDNHYFNFEFNCIGTCDASYRLNRNEKKSLSAEDYASIQRYATAGDSLIDEPNCLASWNLTLLIPFKVMKLDSTKLPSSIRANFYHCTDGSPVQRFLSWNPIHTTSPDFHQPEFFGKVTFK